MRGTVITDPRDPTHDIKVNTNWGHHQHGVHPGYDHAADKIVENSIAALLHGLTQKAHTSIAELSPSNGRQDMLALHAQALQATDIATQLPALHVPGVILQIHRENGRFLPRYTLRTTSGNERLGGLVVGAASLHAHGIAHYREAFESVLLSLHIEGTGAYRRLLA
ncbi:hypothetical protein WJX72_012025 [[Myrmecia] bisecta]|uniref:Uncharacterized protein n=1 Tax=[Myrmecia] bisecta TaxID=41462 RepID=A0AAW1P601_9CHLO